MKFGTNNKALNAGGAHKLPRGIPIDRLAWQQKNGVAVYNQQHSGKYSHRLCHRHMALHGLVKWCHVAPYQRANWGRISTNHTLWALNS